jgi:signal transduction histidine kinase
VKVTGDNTRMRRLRRAAPAVAWAAVLANAFLVVIWATTGTGAFWPKWVMAATGLVVGSGWWVDRVGRDEGVRARFHGRALAVHAGLAAILGLFQIAIWLFSGRGYFWPVWVLGALGLTVGLHVAWQRSREGEQLAERVEELTVSRAGAVQAAEAQLRRIERDLHDGAQARLVALGMNIGLAEQQLASDPERAQQHLADARTAAGEALRELRDLARGIHPPILADRGLGAAIGALATTAAVPVAVNVELAERPPPAVETAAYFVAAEALTNALKHANASRIDVAVHERADGVVVRVLDDGEGGASEAGGLHGIRQRVEALDGALRIASPAGGPTVVEAVLPCGR